MEQRRVRRLTRSLAIPAALVLGLAACELDPDEPATDDAVQDPNGTEDQNGIDEPGDDTGDGLQDDTEELEDEEDLSIHEDDEDDADG